MFGILSSRALEAASQPGISSVSGLGEAELSLVGEESEGGSPKPPIALLHAALLYIFVENWKVIRNRILGPKEYPPGKC